MRRPMPSPGRTVVHRPAPHWRPVTGSQTGSHAVEMQPSAGRETGHCRHAGGALLHGFGHWARQATVTDPDAQSVISRWLCAHNADYLLLSVCRHERRAGHRSARSGVGACDRPNLFGSACGRLSFGAGACWTSAITGVTNAHVTLRDIECRGDHDSRSRLRLAGR